MRSTSFALALLTSALAAPALTAAPAPPPEPVRLSVTLDRASYLLREPILAECALTNVANREVLVLASGWSPSYFEGADENGNEVVLNPTCVSSRSTDTPLTALRPGQTVRCWLLVSGDYTAPPGVGRYKLRAYGRVGYTYSDQEHGEDAKVQSDELAFEATKAEGDDAEVVKRIEDVRLKDFPPLAAGSSPKQRREWERDRRTQCNGWLSDLDLVKEVAKQTKSARFRAVACCWRGFDLYYRGYEGAIEEAGRLLTTCRKSDESSPYMKGFAGYYLLLCKLEDKSDDGRREARKLAEALIDDYPKTFMADKAREALDQLKTAPKK
jgi:hypothetical protein